jgi:hypothetical protein
LGVREFREERELILPLGNSNEQWGRRMSKKEKGGNSIPKNTQLMLLTVGTRRSKLNRIFWVRREKYQAKPSGCTHI